VGERLSGAQLPVAGLDYNIRSRLVSHNAECYVSTGQDKTSLIKK